MELLAWKLRVSTLWIFLGVGMLAGMFAVVMPADVLDKYIATGEFEGEKIDATLLTVMVMLFCLLPLTMAFLTLVLRDPITRYANAFLGVVATVMWAWDLAEHSSKELEIGLLVTVTLIIAGLLIVWHAWKWPKLAEQDLRERRPASSPGQRAAGRCRNPWVERRTPRGSSTPGGPRPISYGRVAGDNRLGNYLAGSVWAPTRSGSARP